MTPSLLAEAGKLLHGEQWKAPLARDLGVDEKTVANWDKGRSRIPPGVARDLGKLLLAHGHQVYELLNKLGASTEGLPVAVPVIGRKVE